MHISLTSLQVGWLIGVGICTLGGTFFFIREWTKRKPLSPLAPLQMHWVKIIGCGLMFVVVPLGIHCLFKFILHAPNKGNWVYGYSFLTECILALFFLKIMRQRAFTMNTNRYKLSHIGLTIHGFLQLLPIVIFSMIGWGIVLYVLKRLGLPIHIDPQPVVQLLLIHNPTPFSMVAIILTIVVFAPICEEVFFRGILLRFFSRFASFKLSLWSDAFIFALVHHHLTTFVPLMLLGYYFCKYYARGRNLWVNIGMHALFNLGNLANIFILKSLVL